ncbi:hypothetical protein [Microvirga makkahensis]|uniref:MYXO-CTERM domain-containing protein n=1 Tax=Microvirga makkahensis TaxID=1128670 RepID=A0A7X3SPJ3_9HYPH|nr:hypothetical protein [Microvirga makkahensis]MXQ12335.1 hypothetical protein [Microvirga makkahensis]
MSQLTALISFLVLTATSALAQDPAPSPAPGGAPPAGDAAAAGGGIMDYWWVILVVIVVALAIWYFSRGRNRV